MHFIVRTPPREDNVDKYGTVRQATDWNIIRHMRFAYWMDKAADAQ